MTRSLVLCLEMWRERERGARVRDRIQTNRRTNRGAMEGEGATGEGVLLAEAVISVVLHTIGLSLFCCLWSVTRERIWIVFFGSCEKLWKARSLRDSCVPLVSRTRHKMHGQRPCSPIDVIHWPPTADVFRSRQSLPASVCDCEEGE